MKIFKQSQVAMLALAFMVMTAGYINYRYDPKREENLGGTVKVDSKDVYLYSLSNSVDVYSETKETVLDKDFSIYNSKDLDSNEKSIAEFKETRNNMFSELEETYKELISINVNSSEVKIYNEKLDSVIKTKHLIDIVEGIIKAKGIEDIAVVPSEDKYNVIVKLKDEPTNAQIAMIQKIVQEEFNTETKNIRIITKNY